MADGEPSIPIPTDKRTFGVYTHSRPNGTIFYVGKGTLKRARDLRACSRNRWHVIIVKKYGRDNIKIAFTACESEAHAFAEEVRLIAHYRESGIKLVNVTDGGEGAAGMKLSDEQRKKHSRRMREVMSSSELRAKISATVSRVKRGTKLSPEHQAKISAVVKAAMADPERRAVLNRRGKKHSPETRAKIAVGNRGKRCSADTLARMRLAQKGKIHSLEARSKMSKTRRGRKLSSEHKQNIKNAMSLPEIRAKCGFAKIGKKLTIAHRAKLAKAQKARRESDALLRTSINTKD